MKTLILKSNSAENYNLLLQLAEKLGFYETDIADESVMTNNDLVYDLSDLELSEINIGLTEIKNGKGIDSKKVKLKLNEFL